MIRPDHLGDLVLTSPAVEVLRTGLPDGHLTMMAGPWAAGVARRDPMIDEVLAFPFPGFTRAPKGSLLAPYVQLLRAAADLRGRYDAALVLRFDHWWGALLAAAARVPVRVGHRVRDCLPFLTHSVQLGPRAHWVERSVAVANGLLALWGRQGGSASKLPGLRFQVRQEDEEQADELLEPVAAPMRRLVCFHPGAGSATKLWPEDHWQALGDALSGRDVSIIVTGAAAEAGSATRIASAIPGAVSLAGRTDLGSLAAVLKRAAVVVGVDNGPLHLAVAVDTPSVQIFGPSDPSVFGPWGDPSRHRVVVSGWPGAGCGLLDVGTLNGGPPDCMQSVSTTRVLSECVELLEASD